jgi:Viral coat protein P2 N-terminal domain
MRTIRMPQLQNVGPNQRVSIRLPLGQTYQKLYLVLGTNILKSLISNIRMRINNKEFVSWSSAAHMELLLAYKGNNTSTATMLVIDFTERLAREEAGMQFGAIAATQEAGVQELTLEFDLGTYTAVPASTIEAWADVDMPSGNPVIARIQSQQKVFAAAAEENIYVPFGANGYQVKRLVFVGASIDSARVRRDGSEIFESLPAAVNNARQIDFGRVPQAGSYIVDFMPDSLQSNAFNTALLRGADGKSAVPVQNLDIRLKVTAGTTVTTYIESYSLNSQL